MKVRRNFCDPFLQTFDFPDRGEPIGRRPVTIVPSQALAMLNSPLVHELARDWGERLAMRSDGLDARMDHAWLAALGRGPDAEERDTLRKLEEQWSAGDERRNSLQWWKDVAHIVFNHPDFAWLD